jgi:hypothetical protein
VRALDRVLAVHDSRLARGTVVAAPAAIVWGAAGNIDLVKVWRRDPVVRVLIAGRAIPDAVARRLSGARTRRAAPPSVCLHDLPERGHWIRLVEEPGREFVFGAVGHYWGPRVEWRECEAGEFVNFWEPGCGKIAAGVLVEPAGERRTLLVLETRTAATDPVSGVRFRRYWRFAGPGVWLILGRVLAAIRAEAEARASWGPAA